jgi:hypothetical protein
MNSSPLSNPLATVERTALVLGVALTVVAAVVWGAAGAGAAGLGAALGCLNLMVMGRLAAGALARARAGQNREAGYFGFGLAAKMLGLFGLVWVALSVIKVAAIPFALGFSALVLALIGAGLWLATRQEVA